MAGPYCVTPGTQHNRASSGSRSLSGTNQRAPVPHPTPLPQGSVVQCSPYSSIPPQLLAYCVRSADTTVQSVSNPPWPFRLHRVVELPRTIDRRYLTDKTHQSWLSNSTETILGGVPVQTTETFFKQNVSVKHEFLRTKPPQIAHACQHFASVLITKYF
jgi:hypothetical protein